MKRYTERAIATNPYREITRERERERDHIIGAVQSVHRCQNFKKIQIIKFTSVRTWIDSIRFLR